MATYMPACLSYLIKLLCYCFYYLLNRPRWNEIKLNAQKQCTREAQKKGMVFKYGAFSDSLLDKIGNDLSLQN